MNESSGATPIRTAVRAAPAIRIACTNAICERPGHDHADGREDEHVAGVDRVGERAGDEGDQRDDQETRRGELTVAPTSTGTPRDSP